MPSDLQTLLILSEGELRDLLRKRFAVLGCRVVRREVLYDELLFAAQIKQDPGPKPSLLLR